MPNRTFTLLPAAAPVKCASCGVQISWRYAAEEFFCPACGCGLRLRRRYFVALNVVGIGISALVAYAVGLRDDALFAAVVLALLPVRFLLTVLNMRLFPPEVELSGDFRGILYTRDPEDPSRPPDAVVLGAPRNITPPDEVMQTGGARTFELRAQPRTLEGVVIYVGAAALVVSMIYFAMEPVIHRLVPEFGATKHGPSSFPVTVHVGASRLRVINGSTEPWNCHVALGRRHLYYASFTVNAQGTRDLRYREFRREGVAGTSDAHFRRAARQEIELDCSEQSGRTHFWTFR